MSSATDGGQFALRFPARTGRRNADFEVTDCNRAAHAAIQNWRDWPLNRLVLSGPPASGKSHLLEIWRIEAGAETRAAADIDEAFIKKAMGGGAVAVDDAHVAANPKAMFHLVNAAASQKASLLIVGRAPIAAWSGGLPDLASRLSGSLQAEIGRPDDALMRLVFEKQFADRGLEPDDELLTYLIKRSERSFAAIAEIVAGLDAATLNTGRKLTKPLAGAVLDALSKSSPGA